MAERSSPNASPSLRAIACRMSTKWSDDEISCRMSTMATRWSRSRCSSATRALSRATSSSRPESSSVGGGIMFVCSILRRDVLVELCAVESNDLVATRFLGDVEGLVSRLHESVAVRDAGVWPCGDSKARRALQGTAFEGKSMRLDAFTHPFRERDRRVEHRARKQEHELLATVTAHAVDFAHGL